ncbi:hypothetical protein D3C81_1942320 [compost metagenome]
MAAWNRKALQALQIAQTTAKVASDRQALALPDPSRNAIAPAQNATSHSNQALAWN